MKSKKSLLLGSVVLSLSIMSCSSMVESTRQSLTGDSSPRKVKDGKAKWVSRTQYDELMEKYKKLNSKYEALKDSSIKSRSGFDQIDSLAGNSTETINVFENENNPQAATKVKVASGDKVESDISYYQKATTLMTNNKVDEALKIFQFLEKSPVRQVQVRAKKSIGDIYLSKKQYDLALQVYESILHQNSYSSVVLAALEKAVFCSGQLGLVDKKTRYDSLLKDAFEVRG